MGRRSCSRLADNRADAGFSPGDMVSCRPRNRQRDCLPAHADRRSASILDEYDRNSRIASATTEPPCRQRCEPQLLAAMRRYWGYDSFLPLQAEAMQSAMTDRDSVVVLPTGGGKSLCFQAPAVCRDGLALVVSPLISLMKDQVDALRACGVPRPRSTARSPPASAGRWPSRSRRGELKLLYAAPERLLAVAHARLPQGRASCRSSPSTKPTASAHWGHDFRPEYRGLRVLKEAFPGVGVHAYTATATERVQRDIAEQLGLRRPAVARRLVRPAEPRVPRPPGRRTASARSAS